VKLPHGDSLVRLQIENRLSPCRAIHEIWYRKRVSRKPFARFHQVLSSRTLFRARAPNRLVLQFSLCQTTRCCIVPIGKTNFRLLHCLTALKLAGGFETRTGARLAQERQQTLQSSFRGFSAQMKTDIFKSVMAAIGSAEPLKELIYWIEFWAYGGTSPFPKGIYC